MMKRILDNAKAAGIPVRFEERNWFAQLPYKAHQGCVALAQPYSYASLHDVLGERKDGPRLFVILDHITDPHNLGAIIRTAESVGADAVVIPERRAAGVNATVRKAAAGAAEHLPVVRVANIADTIRTLKKANIWAVGADASRESQDMVEADLNRDLALVMGAEDGLSQLVKRECDFLVRIPMHGQTESLNASVATAVLLYEALRQRRPA
jgi:23S rRNA (guanosine2251-2'-O)-methyltransferase